MIRLRCIKTFSISNTFKEENENTEEMIVNLKNSTVQEDFLELLENEQNWEKDHFRVNEDIELYNKNDGSFVIFRFLKRFEGTCIKYELSNGAWNLIKKNFAKI